MGTEPPLPPDPLVPAPAPALPVPPASALPALDVGSPPRLASPASAGTPPVTFVDELPPDVVAAPLSLEPPLPDVAKASSRSSTLGSTQLARMSPISESFRTWCVYLSATQ